MSADDAKPRKYRVVGTNRDTNESWIEAEHLPAIKAHDLATDLRERFPADKYRIEKESDNEFNT